MIQFQVCLVNHQLHYVGGQNHIAQVYVPTFAQNVPTFEENVPTFEEIVPSLVLNRPTRV